MVRLVNTYPYGIKATLLVYCAGTVTVAPPADIVCVIPFAELTTIGKYG